MKRGITRKMVLSYLTVVLLTVFVIGLIFTVTIRQVLERQTYRALTGEAQNIADFLRKEAGTSDKTPVENRLREVVRSRISLSGVASDWVVLTKDMKVLYPRNTEDAAHYNAMFASDVSSALQKNPATRKLVLHAENMEYMGAVVPMDAVMLKAKGYILVYAPVGPVNQVRRSALTVLMISLAIAGIVAFVLAIFQAKAISRPVLLLKARAESLAGRDFDTRVEIHTRDEFEVLGNTMNHMADELRQYDFAQKKFLQNASHELKTPLMSIQGYAEGLKEGVFTVNDRALDIIMEESNRLKGLVDEIIYLSKLETLAESFVFSQNQLNTVISASVEKMRGLALSNGKHLNMMLYRDQALMCDTDKLTQALINLIGNCLRHCRSEVNIFTINDQKKFRIRIEDDGAGFAEKEAGQIFDRFYKGDKGDTGLGLAITKVIIEKHKGSIKAENLPDGGAAFEISWDQL